MSLSLSLIEKLIHFNWSGTSKCHVSTPSVEWVWHRASPQIPFEESPQIISDIQKRKEKKMMFFPNSHRFWVFDVLQVFFTTIEIFIYSITFLLLRIFVARFMALFSMKEKIIQIIIHKMYHSFYIEVKEILPFPQKASVWSFQGNGVAISFWKYQSL